MMTLWILFCRMSKEADILFTFYARDRGFHVCVMFFVHTAFVAYSRLDSS